VTTTAPKPPRSLGTAGGKLWRAVQEQYELEQHEERLLLEACRVSDVLDALAAMVAADGLVESGPHGWKPHPALVEARMQQVTLAKLFAALRLPDGQRVIVARSVVVRGVCIRLGWREAPAGRGGGGDPGAALPIRGR